MKLIFSLLICMIFVVGFITSVEGVGVGVSPGKFEVKNVLRGGYAERPIRVTIGSEKPINVVVEKRGEVADWISFSEDSFFVSDDGPYNLIVEMTPPDDIPNGLYTGFIRVKTGGLGEGVEGHAASIATASIDIAVGIEVTDVEVRSCRAGGYAVQSAERGEDLVFTADVSNVGNVRFRPEFELSVWDADQVEIVKTETFFGPEVLPTRTESASFRLDTSGLALGQYWVDFTSIDCFSSNTLTFDVLEPGTLRANGFISSMTGKTWATVGENVPVTITFDNIGEKEVVAQFKGRVTKGDRVFQVLESESLRVGISDSEEFTLFFTPLEPGRYVASGRVFYDNKRTFEASTVVNVTEEERKATNILLIVFYVLIFSSILFLLYRIHVERRKYMQKLYLLHGK